MNNENCTVVNNCYIDILYFYVIHLYPLKISISFVTQSPGNKM